MRRLKPNVVLGMGGYITFPGGLITKVLKRPLVLHEANSVAGSANRALSKIAMRTLTGFPNTMDHAEWVGNPIREEFDHMLAPAARYDQRQGPLSILVVGGSLGAAALNESLPAALAFHSHLQLTIIKLRMHSFWQMRMQRFCYRSHY